jgi:hypothetical protein
MKKQIDRLRAALMSTGTISKRDRLKVKWLPPKHHDQRAIVMDALGDDHPLLPRMKRCGEIDEWDNVFYCGMPLCPRCFMRARGKQTRQAIRETFKGATNKDLAFATILLPARLDLADVTDVIEKEKRRLRNFVERQRSSDARWDTFNLVGFWEMGRMKRGDLDAAGRNTKLALEQLEFPTDATDDATVWLPHLHAIVHKGDLTEQEIAKALRNDGHTAPYQVDIRPLKPNRKVNDNIKNLTRYSLKFRIDDARPSGDPLDYEAAEKAELESEEARMWWPHEDIRAYAEWLRLELSGFQSLRFVLGPKAAEGKSAVSENKTVATVGVVEGKTMYDRIEHVSDAGQSSTGGICDVDFDVLFVRSDGVRYNNSILDTNWTDDGELEPPHAALLRASQPPGNTVGSHAVSPTGPETLSERLQRILAHGQRVKAYGREHSGI